MLDWKAQFRLKNPRGLLLSPPTPHVSPLQSKMVGVPRLGVDYSSTCIQEGNAFLSNM